MEQLMQYNSYIYRPGKHNLFTPEELAEIKKVDQMFDRAYEIRDMIAAGASEEAIAQYKNPKHRIQNEYYHRNKESIKQRRLSRERAKLEQRRKERGL